MCRRINEKNSLLNELFKYVKLFSLNSEFWITFDRFYQNRSKTETQLPPVKKSKKQIQMEKTAKKIEKAKKAQKKAQKAKEAKEKIKKTHIFGTISRDVRAKIQDADQVNQFSYLY